MKQIIFFSVLLLTSLVTAQEQQVYPENKPLLIMPTLTVDQSTFDYQHFKATLSYEPRHDSFVTLIKYAVLESMAPGHTALTSDLLKEKLKQALQSFGFKEQDFMLRQYEGSGGATAFDMILLGNQAKLSTVYHEMAHNFHNHYLIRLLTEYTVSFISQLFFFKSIAISLFSGLSCKEKSRVIGYSLVVMGITYFMLNYIFYPTLRKAQEYQADRSAVEHLLADGKIDELLPDLLAQKNKMKGETSSRFHAILSEWIGKLMHVRSWCYETHPEWADRWDAMKRTLELMGYDVDKELERYEKELVLSKSNLEKPIA